MFKKVLFSLVFLLVVAGLVGAQEKAGIKYSLAEVMAAASPKTVLVQSFLEGSEKPVFGSGAVISADGYVLTCSHVVRDPQRVKVVLSSGKAYEARLLGQNFLNDYALLKIKAADLQCFELGDSDTLEIGQKVLGLGYPGGPSKDNKPTAAMGKVLALGRNLPVQGFERYYANAIKTDINSAPGSSGGPLVTMDGRLVGVNGAIMMFVDRTYSIPISAIKKALPTLKEGKHVQGTKPKSFAKLMEDLRGEFTQEELQELYGKVAEHLKDIDPKELFEKFKRMFGESQAGEITRRFKELFENARGGLGKALEKLFGEEGFQGLQKQFEKFLEDPESLGKLSKQFEKIFGELFGKREPDAEEEKKEYEPPEGKELDRAIEKLLEEVRKRVEEREKTEADFDSFRKKIEKLLDEVLGERPAQKTQPEKTQPAPEGPPYIGVRLVEPSEALRYQLGIVGGLIVDAVKENSPADKAGLRPNDILLKIGRKSITSLEDMAQALEGKKPGDRLKLIIIVRGSEKEIELELGSR